MIIEEQKTIDYYADLLEKIKERVGDGADSLAILAEIRKDFRSEQIQQKKVINEDLPATDNQMRYLKYLGVEIPEAGLNRQQASQLIDDGIEKKGVKKAVTQQIRMF